MKIPYYQIDAFTTEKSFSGNPAGVCILDEWLPDELLQSIAFENNLSETAFIIETQGRYKIRWFTPAFEMDLCGHATLAPAFLIMNIFYPECKEVIFDSPSGELFANKEDQLCQINFPARMPTECCAPEGLIESIGIEPLEVFKSRDYLLLFDNEDQIRKLKPNFNQLSQLGKVAVICTSVAKNCDFVSRFFAPGYGVNEDPVTGSAHSTLIPFWADRLNKDKLHAQQLSDRGGELWCTSLSERVLMAGKCTVFLKGDISI